MRIAIVEDHLLFSRTLALALEQEGVGSVAAVDPAGLGAEEVLGATAALGPDLVLLDVHLGEHTNGLCLIGPLVARAIPVLVLTASRDRRVMAECLEAGAAGVFHKATPLDLLVPALADAAAGRTVLAPAAREALLEELESSRTADGAGTDAFAALTEREGDVLRAMVDGFGGEGIGAQLCISLPTVRTHVRAVLTKLGVNSQLAAVALARRAGWPPPSHGGD